MYAPFDDSDADTQGIIRNRIVITLDPEYIIEEDVLKIDLANFLDSIGAALGLFLGMTAITFVQTAYWICTALYMNRKARKVKPLPSIL